MCICIQPRVVLEVLDLRRPQLEDAVPQRPLIGEAASVRPPLLHEPSTIFVVYVYVYVNMYIYIYIYIFTHTYIYIYIYI